MPADEFTRQRTEKLVGLYQSYREALDQGPHDGRMMDYRWWVLPDRLDGSWIIYSQMLEEFATELANAINDLTHCVDRLAAWAKVVAPLGDEDRHEATHEFIDQLGTVALGLPYAIKSRFTFAAGHLCHQANRTNEQVPWEDNFPEKNLYLNDIDPFCRSWRRFRAFKLSVERIAARTFKDATDDYRNRYNHGFASRLLLGFTGLVTREVNNGRVSYAIGGRPPLDLDSMADVLRGERDQCYAAFSRFQLLVAEQIAAIEEVGRSQVNSGRSGSD